MIPKLSFFKNNAFIWLSLFLIVALVGSIEFASGRSPFGPDGQFGLWAKDVWSSENSQRFADAYSFSHMIHGVLFYAFLWLVARKMPIKYRFLLSLILEGIWELFENSPIIINRYREATIALGYNGDSILNSLSDILMMALGFGVARISKVWMSILFVITLELVCLFWIRDNLTLNIVMLIHPIEAIKVWQAAGH